MAQKKWTEDEHLLLYMMVEELTEKHGVLISNAFKDLSEEFERSPASIRSRYYSHINPQAEKYALKASQSEEQIQGFERLGNVEKIARAKKIKEEIESIGKKNKPKPTPKKEDKGGEEVAIQKNGCNIYEQDYEYDIEMPEIGTKVSGVVEHIVSYGAFVKISPHLSGLLHISRIADAYIEDVLDWLYLGQELECIVVGVKEGAKIDLSTVERKLEPLTDEEKEKASKMLDRREFGAKQRQMAQMRKDLEREQQAVGKYLMERELKLVPTENKAEAKKEVEAMEKPLVTRDVREKTPIDKFMELNGEYDDWHKESKKKLMQIFIELQNLMEIEEINKLPKGMVQSLHEKISKTLIL